MKSDIVVADFPEWLKAIATSRHRAAVPVRPWRSQLVPHEVIIRNCTIYPALQAGHRGRPAVERRCSGGHRDPEVLLRIEKSCCPGSWLALSELDTSAKA
jgi:hypothetical protein